MNPSPPAAPPPPSFHADEAPRSRQPKTPLHHPNHNQHQGQRYYAEPPQRNLDHTAAKPAAAAAQLPDDPPLAQIHREMQDRLIRHLAREGKVYPPPRPLPVPQAQHPIFANDGSFLETFKRLQRTQGADAAAETVPEVLAVKAAPLSAAIAVPTPKPAVAMFGKRRGGKILKTGVVAKQKALADDGAGGSGADTNDAWAMYLQEVQKYKSVSCDSDAKTRPLVK